MYAYYNGKLFSAHRVKDKFMIGSKVKEEGFEEYIDVLGRRHTDYFVKLLDLKELDYLYEISYQVQFKNRWYHLDTAINPLAISENHYEISLDFRERELAEQLGFERPDKFYYSKRLHREDIEALKVIETPLGRFSEQGQIEQIVAGADLDNYLEKIMKDTLNRG